MILTSIIVRCRGEQSRTVIDKYPGHPESYTVMVTIGVTVKLGHL